jgi:hypothetical protein
MRSLICHPSTSSPLQIELSSNAMHLANGDIQLRYVLQSDLEQILISAKMQTRAKR